MARRSEFRQPSNRFKQNKKTSRGRSCRRNLSRRQFLRRADRCWYEFLRCGRELAPPESYDRWFRRCGLFWHHRFSRRREEVSYEEYDSPLPPRWAHLQHGEEVLHRRPGKYSQRRQAQGLSIRLRCFGQNQRALLSGRSAEFDEK